MLQAFFLFCWKRRFHFLLYSFVVLMPWLGTSCSGTVLPVLQHFKRPTSMTSVVHSTDGSQHLYVANADIDRLALVHVAKRSLLIDPSPKTPGIYQVKTGRYPVSIASSPDNSKIYTLHGIDGNIGVSDTKTFQPVLDGKEPLRLPKGCKGPCWKNPTQLVLHNDTDAKRTLGFITVPSDSMIVVVDLTEKGSKYGSEVKRIRIPGLPNSIFKSPKGSIVYVTNTRAQWTDLPNTKKRKSVFIHAIDTKTLNVQNISICESVLEDNASNIETCGTIKQGSVSEDGQFLYLIDQVTGGIRIYDTKAKKLIPQGDARYPETQDIRLRNGGAFLAVQFLPATSIVVKDAKGQNTTLKHAFAWATASDGYVYVIDSRTHRILDTNPAEASAQQLTMFVGTSAVGDPREPARPGLPKIKVEDSTKNPLGITLFSGKTRSENWKLSHQGELFTNRSGRFSDLAKGVFVDAQSQDLTQLGVQKGDTLSLQDCIPPKNPPSNGETAQGTPCKLNILSVARHRLEVDVKGQTIPQKDAWKFSIQTPQGSYLVEGSVTGRLSKRLIEDQKYTCAYFSLLVAKGSEPTPEGTRIEFTAESGVTDGRTRVTGLPSHITALPAHQSCASRCQESVCQQHPSCTKTQCESASSDTKKQCAAAEDCVQGTCIPQRRVWVLDPSSSQLFVINPTDLKLETTIR